MDKPQFQVVIREILTHLKETQGWTITRIVDLAPIYEVKKPGLYKWLIRAKSGLVSRPHKTTADFEIALRTLLRLPVSLFQVDLETLQRLLKDFSPTSKGESKSPANRLSVRLFDLVEKQPQLEKEIEEQLKKWEWEGVKPPKAQKGYQSLVDAMRKKKAQTAPPASPDDDVKLTLNQRELRNEIISDYLSFFSGDPEEIKVAKKSLEKEVAKIHGNSTDAEMRVIAKKLVAEFPDVVDFVTGNDELEEANEGDEGEEPVEVVAVVPDAPKAQKGYQSLVDAMRKKKAQTAPPASPDDDVKLTLNQRELRNEIINDYLLFFSGDPEKIKTAKKSLEREVSKIHGNLTDAEMKVIAKKLVADFPNVVGYSTGNDDPEELNL